MEITDKFIEHEFILVLYVYSVQIGYTDVLFSVTMEMKTGNVTQFHHFFSTIFNFVLSL